MQHLLAGVVIFFTCLLTKKYGSNFFFRAKRENNLTIGGGKTMGGEPAVRGKHIISSAKIKTEKRVLLYTLMFARLRNTRNATEPLPDANFETCGSVRF